MQIAQINVAHALHDLDDPRMSGFVRALDRVNALADASPGFVWRLQTESGNATDISVSDDPRFIVNMSVWETIENLFDFVYRTSHREVMVRRRRWFAKPEGLYQALWWVEAGRRPTPAEGLERLAHLEAHGPSARAFTFKESFPPRGSEPEDLHPEPYCVGWA